MPAAAFSDWTWKSLRSLFCICLLYTSLGCDVIPAVTLDGRVVSSTYIRELLENGEVERANAFLGHPHTLSDTVHYGYRLGTKMGTPTINMQFPDGVLVPRHGVYAAKV